MVPKLDGTLRISPSDSETGSSVDLGYWDAGRRIDVRRRVVDQRQEKCRHHSVHATLSIASYTTSN